MNVTLCMKEENAYVAIKDHVSVMAVIELWSIGGCIAQENI